MNNIDMQKAREWAEWSKSVDQEAPHTPATAAAEVILSLQDHWIEVEKVREVINGQLSNYEHGTVGHSVAEDIACKLQSLLAPSLPTLAELIEQGNDPQQYQWMQADHIEHGRVIITHPSSTYIYYMKTSGLSGGASHSGADCITPLPDLPKLEWPAQEPQPEYRPNLGPITLTPPAREEEDEVRGQFGEPTLPLPEDVPPGEPWSVRYYGKEWAGVRADDDRAPWSIISMDGLDYRDVDDSEVTLMFRLVPETP